MDTSNQRTAAALSAAVAVLLVVGIACGGGGQGSQATPTVVPTPEFIAAPSPETERLDPPFEGPPRDYPKERTNYREEAAYQLPDPAFLPEPEDSERPEFQFPDPPECPEGWERMTRGLERFRICHPPDWTIEGHGYVTRGWDDRWYAVSFFRMDPEGVPLFHVSVYVTGPFSPPTTYVAQCDEAYRVTLSGAAASVCPDYPGELPEAKIIAYHLRDGDLDYFLNVVPRFPYDDERGGYLTHWSKKDEETAFAILRSFELIEVNIID